jgi:hypothetical protein
MATYVWPLSATTTPDETNTSFGPRVNKRAWDFHDGIDLPAAIGTPVVAMRAGTVHRGGPSGTHGFSSRHVILKVDDPSDGDMFLVYLHLSAIDPAVSQGVAVTQGQVLGAVGDDNAQYPHLHFEFRKGKAFEKFSVHPLRYLPYADTANFTAPVEDRFNRLSALMAARLLFGAGDRREGDLRRIEVDLLSGDTVFATRVADFNDKTTINEGNGEHLTYVGDIGVEGYQQSDLIGDGRVDLKYGILVRNLPSTCDRLIARVIDIGNHIAKSAVIRVLDQAAIEQTLYFEDGAMPPAGWRKIAIAGNGQAAVDNDPLAAFVGARGMRCTVSATSGTQPGSACIEFELPERRFEWLVEGWFQPAALQLGANQSLDLLHFLNQDDALSIAARIRNRDGVGVAGLIAQQPGGSMTTRNSNVSIAAGFWRKWKLHLLRIGTRETTAVLYLDDIERTRLNWDATQFEPRKLRVGIGRISAGASATLLSDELRLTEATAKHC